MRRAGEIEAAVDGGHAADAVEAGEGSRGIERVDNPSVPVSRCGSRAVPRRSWIRTLKRDRADLLRAGDGACAASAGAEFRSERRASIRPALALIALLTLIKLALAATTPLSFDEALYWRYSRHLAFGYIDHPFMNPLAIRLGTWVFGDDPFGVRVVSVASSLLASWALWRAALTLFEDRALAVTALVFANVTLTFTLGAVLATSDQMVVTTSCLLLLALAQLERTGRGVWWLAVGGAFGLGLCAKYTTAFFGPGILIWVMAAPARRRWLFSGWSWAGAAVALALFSPVLVWNAQHQWASFVYQAGRMTVFRPSVRYIGEYVGALAMLTTPLVFGLSLGGLNEIVRGRSQGRGALLPALVTPLSAYLLWHSTHQRVQGNWCEPVVPMLAVAAAVQLRRVTRIGEGASVWFWIGRGATPCALVMSALGGLAIAGLGPPLGAHDLRARAFGLGWETLAPEIVVARRRADAGVILTTDYTLASWMRFYLADATPIEQIDERIRWSNEPDPPASALVGSALYVCKEPCSKRWKVADRYGGLRLLDRPARRVGTRVVDRYRVYQADHPLGPVLDPPNHLPLADHAE